MIYAVYGDYFDGFDMNLTINMGEEIKIYKTKQRVWAVSANLLRFFYY